MFFPMPSLRTLCIPITIYNRIPIANAQGCIAIDLAAAVNSVLIAARQKKNVCKLKATAQNGYFFVYFNSELTKLNKQLINLFAHLQLTIDDCLGCRQVEVRFSKTDRVHLLLYSADRAKAATTNDEGVSSWAITPVARALQLLCSKVYVSAESLQRMPQLQVGKGCVKMSFSLSGITDPKPESDLDMEPSTSQQALQREQLRRQQRMHREITYNVTVVRRFDDVHVLERVRWQVNGGEWRETSITEFHSIFFVHELHKTSELLRTVQDTFAANNWLKVIQADGAGFRSFL